MLFWFSSDFAHALGVAGLGLFGAYKGINNSFKEKICSKVLIPLSVSPDKVNLLEEPGKEIPVSTSNGNITLPAGHRRYIQFNMTEEEVLNLFANSRVF